MKHWMKDMKAMGAGVSVAAALFLLNAAPVLGAEAPKAAEQTSKVGFVDFKKIVENSKLGKQQQAAFEGMKSQMESLLKDKEKELTELSTKLQDTDYLDGLTPEKENELKHKFRVLGQEYSQAQNQFLQALQQANMKIVQQIQEDVTAAAVDVAKAKGLEAIFNQDAAFYIKPSLEYSDAIVTKMDENFDKQPKPATPPVAEPKKTEAPTTSGK